MSQKQITERVGEGTPGKRVKSAWKSAGRPMPLREWSRLVVAGIAAGDQADAAAWLASKRRGGTDERRQERRMRIRERRSINAAARASRRSKGANKQQQKKKGGDGDSR